MAKKVRSKQEIRKRKFIFRVSTLVCLWIFIIAAVFVEIFYFRVSDRVDQVDFDESEGYTMISGTLPPEVREEEDPEIIADVPEPAIEHVSSVETEILKNYDQEKILNDRNVINVLLIGRDSDGTAAYARADAIILVSINNKDKKLRMYSFLRDTYVYIPTKGYDKLAHSYAYGGAKLLMETIEKHYKININNYVSVNFSTFPKVIDALGGVDMEITEKEASALNKSLIDTSAKVSGGGLHHLNGDQALAYCRIRKIDSEVERTGRQRKLLLTLMNKMQDAEFAQLEAVMDALFPYLKTDFTREQLLAHSKNGKMYAKYEMSQKSVPRKELCTAAMIRKTFYWVTDFPASAKELQEEIYG